MQAKNNAFTYTYHGSPPSRFSANLPEIGLRFGVIPAKAGIHF